MNASRQFVELVKDLPHMTVIVFIVTIVLEWVCSFIFKYPLDANTITYLACFTLSWMIILQSKKIHEQYKILDVLDKMDDLKYRILSNKEDSSVLAKDIRETLDEVSKTGITIKYKIVKSDSLQEEIYEALEVLKRVEEKEKADKK